MKQLSSVLLAGIATAGLLASGSLLAQPNLNDMFLEQDTDNFDPGLSIGEPFPAIRAIYSGEEITAQSSSWVNGAWRYSPCAPLTGDPFVDRSSGSCKIA